MADLAVMFVNPPRDARGAAIEQRRKRTLEPSTREFVASILAWARGQGIPAVLGETHRSEAEQDRQAREGRTAIPEGKTGWHQYGRAFHLVIVDPKTRHLDESAYERVEVRDLAHFEYHPGLKLAIFRKTPRAARELASAGKRAARYG
jgi:hypothetical protein